MHACVEADRRVPEAAAPDQLTCSMLYVMRRLVDAIGKATSVRLQQCISMLFHGPDSIHESSPLCVLPSTASGEHWEHLEHITEGIRPKIFSMQKGFARQLLQVRSP